MSWRKEDLNVRELSLLPALSLVNRPPDDGEEESWSRCMVKAVTWGRSASKQRLTMTIAHCLNIADTLFLMHQQLVTVENLAAVAITSDFVL